MSAAGLLAELRRRGVELRPDGDRLRFRPVTAVPPDLRGRMAACKPELLDLLNPAHEWSLAEKAAGGFVNPGWTPAGWAARLRQLADRCEAMHADLAATYREWADNIIISV